MTYLQVQRMRKQAAKSSWDPNTVDLNGSQFEWNTDSLNTQLKTSLKNHYAKLLAKAYKESTGETLKNPEKHIDPKFGYVIGRGSNIRPEILAKLNDFYRDRLGGWSTTAKNVSPGLAMDAVDISNQEPWHQPYNYRDEGLEPDKNYRATKQLDVRWR